MEQYTIYCTEEQTKKALELGAPIKTISYDPPVPPPTGWVIYKENCCKPPTTEQMSGWLEEKGFEFYTYKPVETWIVDVTKGDFCTTTKECVSRKEATLAAIDAALDYLIKNKED